MGGNQSKLIQVFRNYADEACDALLAVRFSVAKLGTQHLKGLGNELTEVDLDRWNALLKMKNLFIGEVQAFAESTATKLRIVKGRIGNERYSSFEECYRGFDREETLSKIEELQSGCISLKADFEAFREHLENTYPPSKVQRITQLLFCAGACLCIAVAIALHLIPGVAFVLGPAIIIGCLSAGAVLGISAGALYFSKSDVEKAIDFIKNIEDRLGKIRDSMSSVRATSEALTMAEREECSHLISGIIKECDKVVEACRTV